MGDPSGIGPEITLKAWKKLRTSPEYSFALIATEQALTSALKDHTEIDVKCFSEYSPQSISDVFSDALPIIRLPNHVQAPCIDITPGHPDAAHAQSIIKSIEHGVDLVTSGEADALVTNPISKDVLYKSGFTHPGHTEFLGALTEHATGPYADPSLRGPIMMLSGGGLRVALATVHIPLKRVVSELTQEKIINTARVMNAALKTDFGIARPRIAFAGLNPHAGENGALGPEEIDIINPAAHLLRSEGLDVTDAQPADTLFHTEAREGYDAVLAMYHDQGLIPVKTLDFHGGVNITLGLPIIRTSPDHGTAFNIAGQNIARPDSLIAAIKTAREIADNRLKYAG